eukprot:2578474-Pleurochrysis_carterae.AAC.1
MHNACRESACCGNSGLLCARNLRAHADPAHPPLARENPFVAQARQEMNERMEDRERARRDIVLQAQGDLSESDEKRLKQKVVATNLQSHLKSRETDHEKQA